jgi:glycosyltransferase involved in cell wall biosynthesis
VLSGFPNLLTVHGNIRAIAKVTGARPFSYDWLTARLEKWTLPRTDGVICITRYTQAEVQDLVRRTWIVPNAVDSSLFEVKNVPASPPQILHIAHIHKRKNQIALIHALDPLVKELPFTLRFYGMAMAADPYAQECLRLIRQRSWCEYHPFSDRPTIKAALATASLLVLPSLEENCPMTVLEAMAAGVPVVAAKVGGVPELFEDAVTGLFCDPNDPVSIRTAVQTVLSKPAFARDIAVRARHWANDKFHPDRIVQHHVEIYREMLSTDS